jgi:hypothetical protein
MRAERNTQWPLQTCALCIQKRILMRVLGEIIIAKWWLLAAVGRGFYSSWNDWITLDYTGGGRMAILAMAERWWWHEDAMEEARRYYMPGTVGTG